MFQNNGHFDVRALALVLLSFAFVMRGIVLLRKTQGSDLQMPSTASLALAILVLVYTSTLKEPGIYVIDHLYSAKAILVNVGLLLLMIPFFIFGRSIPSPTRSIVLWMAIIIAFILKIGMLFASPHPSIDVFTNLTNGVMTLASGFNPYLGSDSFDYLPSNLYLHIIPWWLFNDVRGVYIIAELVTLLCFLSIKTHSIPLEKKGLIALLFLYHPRSLFILEQAWIDPLILMLFSLFLVLRERRMLRTASGVFGYMLSTKQYLIFLPIHFAILDRSLKRIVIMIGIALLTILPFVLTMGPIGFIHLAVLPLISTPFRADSLTVSAFFVNVFGTHGVTSLWSLGIGAIATLISVPLLKPLSPTTRFLAGSIMTMYSLFLFGAQAFCNYYYLVGGMILWLLLLHAEANCCEQKTHSIEQKALIG